ncbi:MAG TPA: MBOAT family protein [Vicinamibacterales bacterium]
MIFHSLDFVLFFLVVLTAYWRLPHRAQNRLLLVASYVFYGWVHPWFLGLILFSTTVDYWAARWMEDDPARRKVYLGASLAANLGMLGYFKYANFFADSIATILEAAGLPASRVTLDVTLPVGISFFTFQALSYTVDVYRGQLRARRSFVDVATFVALFPQLVAGPIERASALLPQVEGERRFSADAARTGALLIAWGYFKKLVIADNVGLIADKVFAVEAPGFHVLWAGVLAFGIQIFADFSAYSDIARGVARWFGFELMVNFDNPYFARSPQEFWRRWHISLSTWFRDYVYIPLGGSRRGLPRELANVMMVFLLSGLWHGANWTFVLWGGYHGLLLVGQRLFRRFVPVRAPAWLAPLQIAGMFVLVQVGWLMFREQDVRMLLRGLTLTPAGASPIDVQAGLALALLTGLYALPLVVQGIWSEWLAGPRLLEPPRARTPVRVAWLAGQGLLAGLLFAGILVFRSRASMDFIYFQF